MLAHYFDVSLKYGSISIFLNMIPNKLMSNFNVFYSRIYN